MGREADVWLNFFFAFGTEVSRELRPLYLQGEIRLAFGQETGWDS